MACGNAPSSERAVCGGRPNCFMSARIWWSQNIRGNVDTRLRKLADGECDAIVLAAAGLRRLGRASEITQILPYEIMLPAIGQGALGIEARGDDREALALLARLDDGPTHAAVVAERALLARLRGGCLAPVAGWCRASTPGEIALDRRGAEPRRTRKACSCKKRPKLAAAEALGQRVADALLSGRGRGADRSGSAYG